MNLDLLIKVFLENIQITSAEDTHKYYKNHLGHFQRWINSQYPKITNTMQVTDEIINSYIMDMKATNENITINKNINALKLCYKYSNIEFSYLQSLEYLKERKKHFDLIDEDIFKEIIKYIISMPDDKNNLLYKCMVALLCDTGVRFKELLLIEKNHVDIKNKEILLVHTKNKKDRYVYMTNHVSLPIVKKMLAVKSDHKYLLHNIIKNKPATRKSLIYFLEILQKKFNLNKLHAHMFRHTMATLWADLIGNVHDLQILLGHERLETTQVYLHVSRKKLKNRFQTDFKYWQ